MTIAELQRLNQVHPLTDRTIAKTRQGAGANDVSQTSFGQVLDEQVKSQGIRFSAHALQRMDERNIELSSEDLNRLNNGVERAMAKGSRDSLVLMDEMAYIVNVKNQTVITVMSQEMSRDNVYTDIDSVAIV